MPHPVIRRRTGPGPMLALAVALSVVATAPAAAVDLLGVYDLAADSDPVVRQAQHERLAALEGVTQARAGFLPTLSLTAGAEHTWQDIHDSDNPIYARGSSSFHGGRVSLRLNQPVYRHQTVVGLRQARSAARRAELDFDAARQDLVVRVATRYFEALAAQREFEVAHTELDAVQAHFDATQLRRQRGLASITDLHDARARLATVRALVIEAEDRWDDALQSLRELHPDIPPGLADLRDDLPLTSPDPGDVDAWIEAALARNAGLRAQREATAVARQEVTRQRAARWPTLDVVAVENREKSGGTLFGGGSDIETRNVSLQLSLPLYEGGLVGSRVRQAEQGYASARQQQESLERAVRRQVRSAFFGVTRAVHRADALSEAQTAQRLALEARREGYRSGRYALVEVLDAERDFFQARRDAARARFDYVLESLRLRQAVGALDEESLVDANGWLETAR